MSGARIDILLTEPAFQRLIALAKRAGRDPIDYATRLLEEGMLARMLFLPLGEIVGVDKEPEAVAEAETVEVEPEVTEATALTGAEVRAIRALRAARNSPSQIAARLRLPYQAVAKVLAP